MNTSRGTWLAAVLAGTMIATTAVAALKEGDAAPAFQAQASLAGKTFNYALLDEVRKGPVVVYFYPAAFTSGCTIQAHEFALNQERFAAAGASIVGVSLDSIARLNEFSADPLSCAGKIPVASDEGGQIARSYELKLTETPTPRKDLRGQEFDHARVERTTFIVTPDGRIAATVGGLTPEANVRKALELVEKLAAGKKS
jgi:peroxiredoxin